MKKRLVLIDGINFFYRGAWSGAEVLSYKGEDMSYVLTYFRNLVGMMRGFKGWENTYVICWDGGYDARLRVSSEAVSRGVIPKSYKQERREARETEDPEEKAKAESFVRQMKVAKEMTAKTLVRQMQVPGEEADDVIGSLASKYHGEYDEVLLVTTDRDYFQLLGGHVVIYNSGKDERRDVSYLKSEYGLERGDQWIDVGALAGESGKSSDTIYGVPGIGYGYASKLIAEYGTLDNLIAQSEEALKDEVAKFGSAMELYNNVKAHKYKLKHHVKEMYVLAHLEIVRLARELKAMRTFLDVSLPDVDPSWIDLDGKFRELGFPMGDDAITELTGI